MQFTVRLFDPSSQQVREETRSAPSRVALESELQAGAAVVLSVHAIPRARRLGMSGPDVAWWCRELRTLLVAGMTVVEAIETLRAQSTDPARTVVNGLLVERLAQGQALSVAMASAGAFPAVLVAGVRASERTSSLVDALEDFLRYHEMLEGLRKRVVSAAIYPAVVMLLGSAITLFLLLFVMPRFAGMYVNLRGQTGLTTQSLLSLSRVLAEHGAAVALALAALAAAAITAWRAGLLAQLAASLSEHVAPLRRRIDEFRLAKLYHSLALLFRGGYTLDDAMRQCEALGLGERFSIGIRRAEQSLARGERVSAAFAAAGLTDVVTQRLLAVGERTGNFDQVLQTIAARHSERFTTFIERATRIVEPLLLLLVSLVVGGVVVMMYMPVFDIASSIR